MGKDKSETTFSIAHLMNALPSRASQNSSLPTISEKSAYPRRKTDGAAKAKADPLRKPYIPDATPVIFRAAVDQASEVSDAKIKELIDEVISHKSKNPYKKRVIAYCEALLESRKKKSPD